MLPVGSFNAPWVIRLDNAQVVGFFSLGRVKSWPAARPMRQIPAVETSKPGIVCAFC
jgi:hypothetical protein